MAYCNDCGTWVNGMDASRGMMDIDGYCWRCSDKIDSGPGGD